MALAHRKSVRNAIKAALSASMNDNLANNAALYGVVPATIDFTAGSRQYAECNLDESQVELSELIEFPGVGVYTDDAQDTGEPRGYSFSGAVLGCVKIVIRQRDGANAAAEEDEIDALEDAALKAINDYNWQTSDPVNVIYTRRSKSRKERLYPLGDGFGQVLTIDLQFNVSSKGTA